MSLFTKIIAWVFTASPGAKRLIWKVWYQFLARKIDREDWTFMNYGFAPDGTEDWCDGELVLGPADEPDRLCIQLYHHVASPVSLRGSNVLEVGSGRGGGSSYLARYLKPDQMTGVDYSAEAVSLSERVHREGNLTFVTGDAEALPFPDESFDVVINVESSHCYRNIDSFFAEVHRVLRQDGHFLIADLREAADLQELRAKLETQTGFALLEDEDITGRVADALEQGHERKKAIIAEAVPGYLKKTFEEFAGLEGSGIYRGLRERNLIYARFALRKKKEDSNG